MLILAIETSCDETSLALVRNGVEVVDMITYSQIPQHEKTGGVVPEVASREHIIKIIPCLHALLERNSLQSSEIDAIAVTVGPGLIGALLVGVETAKALAYAWHIPLIPVPHILGHIYSVWLGRHGNDISFPALVLTVSGSHNDLYFMEKHIDCKCIGSSRDDAGGEAFDKVARMLDLPYPGGPHISTLAEKGNPHAYRFPRALINEGYDFSFSGLKTSVKYLIRDLTDNGKHDLSDEIRADIAASFQEAVCDVLSTKLFSAVRSYHAQSVIVAGGVSANNRLREHIQKKAQNVAIFMPVDKVYCTDNAAMIAAAGYYLRRFGKVDDNIYSVSADAKKKIL